MGRIRFSILNLVLLTAVIALALGWYLDTRAKRILEWRVSSIEKITSRLFHELRVTERRNDDFMLQEFHRSIESESERQRVDTIQKAITKAREHEINQLWTPYLQIIGGALPTADEHDG